MIKTKDPVAEKHPLSQLEPAVLVPLASVMGVDLMVNEKAQIWLLHDKPFAELVKWAEYDLDINTLSLVMSSGRQQALGMVIPADIRDMLRHGQQLFLVEIREKQIQDCAIVPLLMHDYTLN